jgi:hypothetical protein
MTMGCFHGQAIGDCLACDIDEAMREVDPAVVAARLIQNATALLKENRDLREKVAEYENALSGALGTDHPSARSGTPLERVSALARMVDEAERRALMILAEYTG